MKRVVVSAYYNDAGRSIPENINNRIGGVVTDVSTCVLYNDNWSRFLCDFTIAGGCLFVFLSPMPLHLNYVCIIYVVIHV